MFPRVFISLVFIVASSQAAGQTMHKCKGADGRTSYQQTPCDASSKTVEQRVVEQEADTPDAMWKNMPRTRQEPSTPLLQEYGSPPVAQSQGASQAEIDSAKASQDFHRRVGRRPIPGTTPVTQQAIQGQPQGRQPQQATRAGPDPNRPFAQGHVQDQHGNRYHRPEGSMFVTDEKTGKLCEAMAGTIRCPP